MKKSPSLYLIGLIAIVAVFEVLQKVSDSNAKIIDYSFWIIYVFLIITWCLSHARKHGKKPQILLAVLCGLLPPIGAPIYFYRTFGIKYGSLKLILSILFLCLLVVVSVIFEKIGRAL